MGMTDGADRVGRAERAGELARELGRAGVGEVEVGARRRAEYGADASNYRVVPQAVVLRPEIRSFVADYIKGANR